MEQLPHGETCDRLWTNFIETVYPLLLILHLPSFYRQFDAFWVFIQHLTEHGSASGFLGSCPSFLALIVSVLFCGSLYNAWRANSDRESNPEVANFGSAKMRQKLYSLTVRSLVILRFPRDPTIFSLSAYLLLHVPLIREESDDSTAFVSIALRAGQAMGLHRDSSHFAMSIEGAEVRRRV